MRWSDEVVSGDVDEAIRLMMMSKVMVVLLPVMVVFLSIVLLSVAMCDSNCRTAAVVKLLPPAADFLFRFLFTKSKTCSSGLTRPWAFSR